MKIFKFLVLISFFLAFTTTSVQAKDREVVTDVKGNEVRSGARYYIHVVSNIIPYAVGPDTPSCPTGPVVLDFRKRRPVSFTPVGSNSTVILEDTYLTVRFNYSHPCLMLISLVWKAGPGGYVTTGGSDRYNFFKVIKYEGEGGSNWYQLAAWPKPVCLGCKWEPVGRVKENGVNYLIAGTEVSGIPIVFVPADEEARIAYKLPSM